MCFWRKCLSCMWQYMMRLNYREIFHQSLCTLLIWSWYMGTSPVWQDNLVRISGDCLTNHLAIQVQIQRINATIFCTCHDSIAVMSCATYYSSMASRYGITIKLIFHRIWFICEKKIVSGMGLLDRMMENIMRRYWQMQLPWSSASHQSKKIIWHQIRKIINNSPKMPGKAISNNDNW